jgi:drug/metabolite transporter (DMT)-like permease
MNQRGTGFDWFLFILLGFFWGSSYLFIKIGVDAGLAPFTLVATRLLFGFLLLAAVVLIAREGLPRSLGMYGHLFVMAILSVALPFSLITWAEQSVDSTLAATLNASVPLFVIPIAAFALIDEKITANKVIGVVVGFIGVAILVGFDPGVLAGTDVLAAVALIGSSISYAAGGVYARRFARGLRPMIPAVVQVGFALIITAVMAFIFESPISFPGRFDALLAVVWLGLLGSGAAYLVFFRLLGKWGATRTSLVAYLLPVYGIALGALVLGEPVDARLVFGTLLVIAGIALVNLGGVRLHRWSLRSRRAHEAVRPRNLARARVDLQAADDRPIAPPLQVGQRDGDGQSVRCAAATGQRPRRADRRLATACPAIRKIKFQHHAFLVDRQLQRTGGAGTVSGECPAQLLVIDQCRDEVRVEAGCRRGVCRGRRRIGSQPGGGRAAPVSVVGEVVPARLGRTHDGESGKGQEAGPNRKHGHVAPSVGNCLHDARGEKQRHQTAARRVEGDRPGLH